MTTRRQFMTGIAGILAAGVEPAVLPSGIIMPVRRLWVPDFQMQVQKLIDYLIDPAEHTHASLVISQKIYWFALLNTTTPFIA